jgi:hypothetical protein
LTGAAFAGLAAVSFADTASTVPSAPPSMISGEYPAYCRALKGGGTPKEKAYWSKQLKGVAGGPLTAHFCLGMQALEKVRTGGFDGGSDPSGHVKRALRSAIQQIAYYEKRLPKGHWMRGEVHRAYAEAYARLGDEAKARFHEAEAGKYDGGRVGRGPGGGGSASAAAYVSMADKMMSLGLAGEAVNLLELAQRLDPDSTAIKYKLERARAARQAAGGAKK